MSMRNTFSMGRDLAIDLGTANTLVYVRGEGIVLSEPSVVAVNTIDGSPLAVGHEAKKMIGRTPSHIQAIRPLKDGVISDFEICEKMLRYFIQKVHKGRFAKPRMVICVPGGVTGVEQRAVKEAAERAFIVEKLREQQWNISKTAELIDTPRSNLYKKIEQYGISQEVDG